MKDKMSKGLIDPRYCCCAIPIMNAGIYAIIAEQTAVGIAVGVLCFTAPTVVGAAVPSFVTYILAIICLVGVAVQPVGFFGVFREKTKTFRVYAVLNAILTALAFIVAAVIVAVSAARHSTAVANCQKTFFTTTTTSSVEQAADVLSEESKLLCNAFAWADIGFMGGLWLLLLLTQTYFVYSARSYSKAQVSDHKLYHSVYSENPEAFTMSILQSRRYNPDSVAWTQSMMANNPPPHLANEWDHRPSYDSGRHEPGPENGGGYYGHQRGYDHGAEGQYDDYVPAGHGNMAGHGANAHPEYAFNAPGPGYVDNSLVGPEGHVHYPPDQHHNRI